MDGDRRLPPPIAAVTADVLEVLLPLKHFFVGVHVFLGVPGCPWWSWFFPFTSWTVSKEFEVVLFSALTSKVMSLIKSSAFRTRVGCPCGESIARAGVCMWLMIILAAWSNTQLTSYFLCRHAHADQLIFMTANKEANH